MVIHSGLEPRASADYQQVLREHSDVFRVARVVCIFCMIYVHVYLFDDSAYFRGVLPDALRVLSVELLGRSSVPLLSVISGLLMVGFFTARSYPQAMRRRAVVLLLPLAFWAALHALLSYALDPGFRPGLMTLLPISRPSLFLHLDFLRDIFVLSALTPALILLLRRAGWVGLALLVVLGVTDWCQPLLLRGQILVFYSVGVFAACYRMRGLSLARWERPVYLAAALLALALLARELLAVDFIAAIPAPLWDLALVRPLGCLMFYFLARRLAARSRWLAPIKAHLEPAVFTLFLSHTITLRLVAGALAKVPLLTEPWLYCLTWFAMPVVCFVAAWGLWRMLGFGPGWLQVLITGKARGTAPRPGDGVVAPPAPVSRDSG